MVLHHVFGVERDIDIYENDFPTPAELEDMEDRLPGCQHGWFDSVSSNNKEQGDALKLHYRKFLPKKPKNPNRK